MIIGVAKEIKNNEFRVGLTPNAASEYVKAGHTVRERDGREAGAALESSPGNAGQAIRE